MRADATRSTTEGRKAAFSFDEARSSEVVNARMTSAVDPRVRQVMAATVRHLHDLVKEVGLTFEEWEATVRFLTSVGQICSDWRQEFILLSDVLGVTMLVDAINHHRPEAATQNTVLGPFHVAGSPARDNGADICMDGKGEPMVVIGQVRDVEGRPVADATLDVWQTNEDGFYDVQQRQIQPAWNLRGLFQTDQDGTYWFRTVKPRFYPIPDDGPVGQLLKMLGRHPNRAAHVHVIVEADGYQKVVTHIFTPDCPYLTEDAVFGVKQSLIANLEQVDDEGEARALQISNPFWRIQQDFVLLPNEQLPSV